MEHLRSRVIQASAFHAWNVTPREAIQIQEQLRAKVITRGTVKSPKLVAGADIAFSKHSNTIYAAVVVLEFSSLEIVETVAIQGRITFPYIPGLLSFREAPALLQAFGKLTCVPDVIFIDGHGRSHPRAAGIACHLGVLLNRPVIGCAKSLLCGTYRKPKRRSGSAAYLYDSAGLITGAALRTRDDVRPVFISI